MGKPIDRVYGKTHNDGMKTEQVINFFGGTQTATAKALGINQSSISEWGEFPPDARQLLVERISKGALKAEPGCLERVIGFKSPVKTKRSPRKQKVATDRFVSMDANT